MFDRLKYFFLNKALGRIITRLVMTLASGLATGAWGVSIELSPVEIASLVSAATSLVNASISYLKPRKSEPAPEAPKA